MLAMEYVKYPVTENACVWRIYTLQALQTKCPATGTRGHLILRLRDPAAVEPTASSADLAAKALIERQASRVQSADLNRVDRYRPLVKVPAEAPEMDQSADAKSWISRERGLHTHRILIHP
jgi:hypothetical protein